MSQTTQRDLVSRLLKQSILTVCREAISYSLRLEVDGILCLTVDNQSQHVVKLHEVFQRDQKAENQSENESAADGPDMTVTRPVKQEAASPEVHVSRGPNITEDDSRDSHSPDIRETDTAASDASSAPSSNGISIKIEVDNEKEEHSNNSDTVKVKPDMGVIGANISAMESVSKNLEKLTVSKAKNILCKKCSAVLKNVPEFENHNMLAHGHFTCLVCLSTFTSRNNMKRHIRLHTGIKPYVCSKCPESFARNDDYKRHLLRHTFEKPFRCAVCKTGYSDRSCVKNHMIKEHNSKVYHICPQCGESYIDSQQFQQHKKSHPEFQDYRCSLCSFTGSNGLMYNKHMLTHGPAKKYLCTHCQLSFPDPFVYTTHLKKHKGDDLVQSFGCCFCEVKLSSYDQFQRHEHSHIQAKQHTCNICQKHFRYPSNLREHMLTHMSKSMYGNSSNLAGHSLANLKVGADDANAEMTEVEENNNSIESLEKDMDGHGQVMEENGSSEYWCTECNHGFSSEEMLHEHISATHEREYDESYCYETDTQEEGTDLHDRQESTGGRQFADEAIKKGIYSADTADGFSKPLKYENDTMDSCVPQKFKRTRVYDEETVVDTNEKYQDILDEEAILNLSKKDIPCVNTVELNIVKDAMRQMTVIQSKLTEMTSERTKKFGMVDDNAMTLSAFTDAYKAKQSSSRKRKSMSPSMLIQDTTKLAGELTTGRTNAPVKVTMDGIKLKFKRDQSSDTAFGPKKRHLGERTSPASNDADARDHTTDSLDEDASIMSPYRMSLNQYSKTSVLGMDTEFSSTPTRGSPTTLNLQVRNPGFEKVVTPEVLFRTKAPFTCEVCEETFQDFESLDSHGIAVHKRFICSYCGKAFTSRPNRERHVRYHTGEKPYKCDLCPASFIRGDDLKYHRTTKHADVKPFVCAACNSSFALPKDLEKHLRVFPEHRQ